MTCVQLCTRLRFLVSCLAALLLTADPARATIKVWVGASGNWTTGANWSPFGMPDQDDDVFLVQSDGVNRTITYNDTSPILRTYRSVRTDSTGAGLITLQQNNADTQLNAEFLYVGNAAGGAYTLFAGQGIFGASEVHAQGKLTIGAGALVSSNTFLQTGGTVIASGQLSVPGTYTYNGGSFSGFVDTGTFISNTGPFGGSVRAANRLVLGGNGNGTFLGNVFNGGPLTLPAGRTLSVGTEFVQFGAMTQLGNVSVGTNTVVGGGATWLQQAGTHTTKGLILGTPEGPGTYAVSPGTQLTANGVEIGLENHGTFTQTGGIVTIGGGVGIRGSPQLQPSRMYWNMSDGTMTHNGFFVVGAKNAMSGTFIQSGGSARLRFLILNFDASTSAAMYLSGGTFQAQEASVSHGSIVKTGGFAEFLGNLDGSGDISVSGSGGFDVTRIRQNAVHVGAGGVINVIASAVSPPTHRVRSLLIDQAGGAFTGRFNLQASSMVVDYTGPSPIGSLRAYLASGYNGGLWNGPGLNSITAALNPQKTTGLGYAEASDILGAGGGTFNDLTVDATSVLIRYTRYGDANLDGIVNLADFNRLAGNFGGSNKVWSQGDFNYDGIVNLADFNRLAANFGLSAAGPDVTPQDWANLAAAVPEPSILGLILLAVVLKRPRRP